MRTHLIAIAALVATSALPISAQNPTPDPSQRPPQQQPQPTDRQADTTQRAGAAANAQAVTVTGCLKAEKDVPGRAPNAAERAGITEDYILTNVKMAASSKTSGIGLAPMYEIEGITEAELQKHLNHQVEIVGSLSQGNAQANRGAAAATGGAASTNADLPQLQGTSLKMVSATCPAAQ